MYVELKNINKTYGSYQASRNVNFGIEKGKLIGLLGPSGSGKTTILRMIAGLETPDSGEVIIDGKVVNDVPSSQRGIGFVFQNYNLLQTLNVKSNILLPLYLGNSKIDEAYFEEIVEILGIKNKLKNLPNTLSGGQQQRVGVARALVVDPDIIFADEPTGNLDSHTSEEVMELMQRVVREQKKTLVMVTHDDHLATYADRVFHIRDGRIIKIEDNRWKKGKEEGGRHAETNTERDRK